MCKEPLCGPGGPIMTTISWWGGVGVSPMRRWRRWWRRTSPSKRLVFRIVEDRDRSWHQKEDTTSSKLFASNHLFTTFQLQVLHTVMEMAMESGPARLAMIVAAISFAQVVILFILFVFFGLGFYLLHVWIMRRPRFWTSPTFSATTEQTSLVQVI